MFNKNRFITQGVKTQIPGYLQNMIWYLIENMEVEKKGLFTSVRFRKRLFR